MPSERPGLGQERWPAVSTHCGAAHGSQHCPVGPLHRACPRRGCSGRHSFRSSVAPWSCPLLRAGVARRAAPRCLLSGRHRFRVVQQGQAIVPCGRQRCTGVVDSLPVIIQSWYSILTHSALLPSVVKLRAWE